MFLEEAFNESMELLKGDKKEFLVEEELQHADFATREEKHEQMAGAFIAYDVNERRSDSERLAKRLHNIEQDKKKRTNEAVKKEYLDTKIEIVSEVFRGDIIVNFNF